VAKIDELSFGSIVIKGGEYRRGVLIFAGWHGEKEERWLSGLPHRRQGERPCRIEQKDRCLDSHDSPRQRFYVNLNSL
jgi:hypothetical protein